MTSVSSDASPRLFSRHKRHARFDRMRYSGQEIEFLTKQASRLSTTEATLWEYLFTNTADQIAAASSLSHLTPPGNFHETGS